MNFCENCGFEITSLYCEHCGKISSSNIPNSFSNDESLAGLLTTVIRSRKSLLFSELLDLTNSEDRTYRIFSQLEKTKNFLLIKQENDFMITLKSNKDAKEVVFHSLLNENKIALLQSLLEIFPLTFTELAELFPLKVSFNQYLVILGKNYQIIGKNTIIKKQNK